MRSAYKSPVIWIMVSIGLLFALAGHILMATIQSDWKYLFFDLAPGGYIIAGFFTFCAIANFIGTRFCVDKEFTKSLPSQLIAYAAVVAVILFFLALALGIENVIGLWALFTAVGSVVLSFPAAFFIRGMAPPCPNDR
jgi:hypothetical protein